MDFGLLFIQLEDLATLCLRSQVAGSEQHASLGETYSPPVYQSVDCIFLFSVFLILWNWVLLTAPPRASQFFETANDLFQYCAFHR